MNANDYNRIAEYHIAGAAPKAAGLRLSYPWAELEPGGTFLLGDPSPQARSKLSSGATTAGKRLGRRFATGKLLDEDGGHIGWWAMRVDGTTFVPVEKTQHEKWQDYDTERRENEARRNRGERVHRRTGIEPVRAIGATDSAYLSPQTAPADMSAVQAQWSATPMPEVGKASDEEGF